MSVFSMAGGNPALPTYPLQRSVRLRASASAYFNRTFGTPTNQKKWTFSCWVKRGLLGITGEIFSAGQSGTNDNYLRFGSGNNLVMGSYNGAGTDYGIITTAVFRDPSAWYHCVFVYDVDNATSTDRAIIYVNGVRQVVTNNANGMFPSGYTAAVWNTAVSHRINNDVVSATYNDQYLTEVNFIDGQALTPSSFGAYNSYGVWSPAKYTGTYGTNGFYLNFQDNSALTTTANIGIGKDSSGNGNYWTSNNISITAGVTYDSMLDVPTLTSNTNSNYAVMNPLKIYTSNLGLTNGNLTLSDSNPVVTSAISTMSFGTSGKFYFECTMVAVATANSNYVGVIDATTAFGTAPFQNKGEYRNTGDIYNLAGTAQTVGATYTTNDVIGVAVDVSAGTVQFYKNNVAQGATPSFTFTAGTELWACVSTDNQVGTKTYAMNFGQRPFTYTPPTGYNRLCTYNLPDSIVPVGAQYMAATTYTSTGTTQSLTNTVNGFSMQPDLVWQKVRSVAGDNYLIDSVRGASNVLSSNTTAAAGSSPTFLTSFNSNGWTQGTGNYTAGATIVGWQWRASNASAVSNTSGSITSQVSANQTAGFSIVTYTGTGANATVGHGLGVAPRMIIVKRRNSTSNWTVLQTSISGSPDNFLYLNSTSAVINAGVVFNGVTPTSTIFGLGTDASVNASGGTFVAYCFAAVPGYSAFGSYTGNGSADGPFVYTGFRPRFVMIKGSSFVSNWFVIDTSRDTYNVAPNALRPNLSDVETTGSSTYSIDIISNGFKLRSSAADSNTSSATFIYACFAENPFKNSLAR